MTRNKGFTLIELLVVIAIIGILASIIIVSLIGVRERARDARRKSDLRSLRTALELYYGKNKKYPSTPTSVNWAFSDDSSWESVFVLGALKEGAVPAITDLPKDPLNTRQSSGNQTANDGPANPDRENYVYGYSAPGTAPQKYDLVARLENTEDKDRAEIKCWRYHTWNETFWHPGENDSCGSPDNGSTPYLIADH